MKLYVNSRKAKVLKELDRQVFTDPFTTNQDCYEFLTALKWGDGYSCKKCNSTAHTKGKQPFSHRYNKCSYDESTTAATLFYKLKFDIFKIFEMLYEITTSKKGANSIWFAERFGLNQKIT